MDIINAFTEGGTIYFHATNIEEFKNIIEDVQKQAQQLNETVARLSNFKFQFKLIPEENKKE